MIRHRDPQHQLATGAAAPELIDESATFGTAEEAEEEESICESGSTSGGISDGPACTETEEGVSLLRAFRRVMRAARAECAAKVMS